MPVIDSYSPTTAEDLMASSALAVSPIMTTSIFDEIYATQQQQEATADTLAVGENNEYINLSQQQRRQDEYFLQQQTSGRRRHHRRSHIMPIDTSTAARFAPPPPSARWRRRLERAISTTSHNEGEEEEDEDFEASSTGDEDRYIHNNHVGPIMPHEYRTRGFPRSATAHFVYGQICLNDRAVNTSPLSGTDNMLDFDVISDDGGQYG